MTHVSDHYDKSSLTTVLTKQKLSSRTPKALWNFVLDSVLANIRERRTHATWKSIRQFCKDRNNYVSARQGLLKTLCNQTSSLKPKQSGSVQHSYASFTQQRSIISSYQHSLEAIEQNYSPSQILLFRHMADEALRKNPDTAHVVPQAQKLWREERLKKNKGSVVDLMSDTNEEDSFGLDQREDLALTLGWNRQDDMVIFNLDRLDTKIDCSLTQVRLNLLKPTDTSSSELSVSTFFQGTLTNTHLNLALSLRSISQPAGTLGVRFTIDSLDLAHSSFRNPLSTDHSTSQSLLLPQRHKPANFVDMTMTVNFGSTDDQALSLSVAVPSFILPIELMSSLVKHYSLRDSPVEYLQGKQTLWHGLTFLQGVLAGDNVTLSVSLPRLMIQTPSIKGKRRWQTSALCATFPQVVYKTIPVSSSVQTKEGFTRMTVEASNVSVYTVTDLSSSSSEQDDVPQPLNKEQTSSPPSFIVNPTSLTLLVLHSVQPVVHSTLSTGLRTLTSRIPVLEVDTDTSPHPTAGTASFQSVNMARPKAAEKRAFAEEVREDESEESEEAELLVSTNQTPEPELTHGRTFTRQEWREEWINTPLPYFWPPTVPFTEDLTRNKAKIAESLAPFTHSRTYHLTTQPIVCDIHSLDYGVIASIVYGMNQNGLFEKRIEKQNQKTEDTGSDLDAPKQLPFIHQSLYTTKAVFLLTVPSVSVSFYPIQPYLIHSMYASQSVPTPAPSATPLLVLSMHSLSLAVSNRKADLGVYFSIRETSLVPGGQLTEHSKQQPILTTQLAQTESLSRSCSHPFNDNSASRAIFVPPSLQLLQANQSLDLHETTMSHSSAFLGSFGYFTTDYPFSIDSISDLDKHGSIESSARELPKRSQRNWSVIDVLLPNACLVLTHDETAMITEFLANFVLFYKNLSKLISKQNEKTNLSSLPQHPKQTTKHQPKKRVRTSFKSDLHFRITTGSLVVSLVRDKITLNTVFIDDAQLGVSHLSENMRIHFTAPSLDVYRPLSGEHASPTYTHLVHLHSSNTDNKSDPLHLDLHFRSPFLELPAVAVSSELTLTVPTISIVFIRSIFEDLVRFPVLFRSSKQTHKLDQFASLLNDKEKTQFVHSSIVRLKQIYAAPTISILIKSPIVYIPTEDSSNSLLAFKLGTLSLNSKIKPQLCPFQFDDPFSNNPQISLATQIRRDNLAMQKPTISGISAQEQRSEDQKQLAAKYDKALPLPITLTDTDRKDVAVLFSREIRFSWRLTDIVGSYTTLKTPANSETRTLLDLRKALPPQDFSQETVAKSEVFEAFVPFVDAFSVKLQMELSTARRFLPPEDAREIQKKLQLVPSRTLPPLLTIAIATTPISLAMEPSIFDAFCSTLSQNLFQASQFPSVTIIQQETEPSSDTQPPQPMRETISARVKNSIVKKADPADEETDNSFLTYVLGFGNMKLNMSFSTILQKLFGQLWKWSVPDGMDASMTASVNEVNSPLILFTLHVADFSFLLFSSPPSPRLSLTQHSLFDSPLFLVRVSTLCVILPRFSNKTTYTSLTFRSLTVEDIRLGVFVENAFTHQTAKKAVSHFTQIMAVHPQIVEDDQQPARDLIAPLLKFKMLNKLQLSGEPFSLTILVEPEFGINVDLRLQYPQILVSATHVDLLTSYLAQLSELYSKHFGSHVPEQHLVKPVRIPHQIHPRLHFGDIDDDDDSTDLQFRPDTLRRLPTRNKLRRRIPLRPGVPFKQKLAEIDQGESRNLQWLEGALSEREKMDTMLRVRRHEISLFQYTNPSSDFKAFNPDQEIEVHNLLTSSLSANEEYVRSKHLLPPASFTDNNPFGSLPPPDSNWFEAFQSTSASAYLEPRTVAKPRKKKRPVLVEPPPSLTAEYETRSQRFLSSLKAPLRLRVGCDGCTVHLLDDASIKRSFALTLFGNVEAVFTSQPFISETDSEAELAQYVKRVAEIQYNIPSFSMDTIPPLSPETSFTKNRVYEMLRTTQFTQTGFDLSLFNVSIHRTQPNCFALPPQRRNMFFSSSTSAVPLQSPFFSPLIPQGSSTLISFHLIQNQSSCITTTLGFSLQLRNAYASSVNRNHPSFTLLLTDCTVPAHFTSFDDEMMPTPHDKGTKRAEHTRKGNEIDKIRCSDTIISLTLSPGAGINPSYRDIRLLLSFLLQIRKATHKLPSSNKLAESPVETTPQHHNRTSSDISSVDSLPIPEVVDPNQRRESISILNFSQMAQAEKLDPLQLVDPSHQLPTVNEKPDNPFEVAHSKISQSGTIQNDIVYTYTRQSDLQLGINRGRDDADEDSDSEDSEEERQQYIQRLANPDFDQDGRLVPIVPSAVSQFSLLTLTVSIPSFSLGLICDVYDGYSYPIAAASISTFELSLLASSLHHFQTAAALKPLPRSNLAPFFNVGEEGSDGASFLSSSYQDRTTSYTPVTVTDSTQTPFITRLFEVSPDKPYILSAIPSTKDTLYGLMTAIQHPLRAGRVYKTQGSFQFGFDLSIYNPKACGSEPLIEPVSFMLEIAPTILPTLSLKLTCPSTLNLNVSPQLLSTITTFVDMVLLDLRLTGSSNQKVVRKTPQSDYFPQLTTGDRSVVSLTQYQSNASVTQVPPTQSGLIRFKNHLDTLPTISMEYFGDDSLHTKLSSVSNEPESTFTSSKAAFAIRNHCGITIYVSVGLNSEKVSVQSGSERPIPLHVDESESRTGKTPVALVTVGIDGFSTVCKMDMFKRHAFYASFQSRSGGSFLMRVASFFERGRRILLLTSPLSVQNSTPLHLILTFTPPANCHDPKLTLFCTPFGWVNAPINVLTWDLRIEPASGSQFEGYEEWTDWNSSQPISIASLDETFASVLSCPPKPKGTNPLPPTLYLSARVAVLEGENVVTSPLMSGKTSLTDFANNPLQSPTSPSLDGSVLSSPATSRSSLQTLDTSFTESRSDQEEEMHTVLDSFTDSPEPLPATRKTTTGPRKIPLGTTHSSYLFVLVIKAPIDVYNCLPFSIDSVFESIAPPRNRPNSVSLPPSEAKSQLVAPVPPPVAPPSVAVDTLAFTRQTGSASLSLSTIAEGVDTHANSRATSHVSNGRYITTVPIKPLQRVRLYHLPLDGPLQLSAQLPMEKTKNAPKENKLPTTKALIHIPFNAPKTNDRNMIPKIHGTLISPICSLSFVQEIRQTTRSIALYTPYIILNNTPLQLLYNDAEHPNSTADPSKQTFEFEDRPNAFDFTLPRPVLYSFVKPNVDESNNQIQVVVTEPFETKQVVTTHISESGDAQFPFSTVNSSAHPSLTKEAKQLSRQKSVPISIGVVNQPQVLSLTFENQSCEVVFTTRIGTGHLGLSKVVNITPRFAFLNYLTSHCVYVRELAEDRKTAVGSDTSSSGPICTVPNNTGIPVPLYHSSASLLSSQKSQTRSVQLSLSNDSSSIWSGGFDLTEIGDHPLLLFDPINPSVPLLVVVSIALSDPETAGAGSSLFIAIKQISAKTTPYWIHNDTPHRMLVKQPNVTRFSLSVPPNSSVPFGWFSHPIKKDVTISFLQSFYAQPSENGTIELFTQKPIQFSEVFGRTLLIESPSFTINIDTQTELQLPFTQDLRRLRAESGDTEYLKGKQVMFHTNDTRVNASVYSSGTSRCLHVSRSKIKHSGLKTLTKAQKELNNLIFRHKSKDLPDDAFSVMRESEIAKQEAYIASIRPVQMALSLTLSLSQVGISFITAPRNLSRARELAYVTFTGVLFDFSESNSMQILRFDIQDFQVDDSSRKAHYPVILQRHPLKASSAKNAPVAPPPLTRSSSPPPITPPASLNLPCFTMSFARDMTEERTMLFLTYFTVLIQTLDFNIDQLFVNNVLKYMEQFDLTKGLKPMKIFRSKKHKSKKKTTKTKDTKSGTTITSQPHPVSTLRSWFPLYTIPRKHSAEKLKTTFIFCEEFAIQPLHFVISFAPEGGAVQNAIEAGEESQSFAHIVGINVRSSKEGLRDQLQNKPSLLSSIPTLFINIDGADFRVKGFVIKQLLSTPTNLQSILGAHFKREFKQTLISLFAFKAILSAPVGLLNGLGNGVHDLVYEPAKGSVHGAGGLVAGVGKGVGRMVKSTAHGAFDAASKVTGTVSTGIGVITLDQDFQKDRAREMADKPQHIFEGFGQGFVQLGKNLVRGVTGIVTKPVEGAMKEGAGGFFKGIGKGLVGIVAKPVIGVVDLGSKVLEGAKNTTKIFDDRPGGRIRRTRFIPSSNILPIFDETTALGATWLNVVGKCDRDEDYVAHTMLKRQTVSGKSSILLITSHRVCCLHCSPTDDEQARVVWAEFIENTFCLLMSENQKQIQLACSTTKGDQKLKSEDVMDAKELLEQLESLNILIEKLKEEAKHRN
ncbi:putative Vacuolar protein sorting-associated protein 13C [Blattamonas nauphoetae]|uniref:Vacuolar protein sorting-associated protein 13C n=1 Tax=Blattamonas nauphoetae TaxID=2049346 RepID=A0ABQ9Y060_9EUKA|nr:putative Vacuolar protein sorting-associated protein 13C [Blattamonas nauphoetae]